MPVRVVDSEEQFAELTNVSKVSVVKFGAPWCGACKFEEASAAYADAQFLDVDVDELEEVAGDTGVTGLPTVVVMKDGKALTKLHPVTDKALAEALEKAGVASSGAAPAPAAEPVAAAAAPAKAEPVAAAAPAPAAASASAKPAQEVTDEDHFAELTKEGVCIVDFYAQWCGACKKFMPEFEALAAAHADKKLLKVDVDENEEIAGEMNVNGLPYFVVTKDGKKVAGFGATAFKTDLAAALEKAGGSSSSSGGGGDVAVVEIDATELVFADAKSGAELHFKLGDGVVNYTVGGEARPAFKDVQSDGGVRLLFPEIKKGCVLPEKDLHVNLGKLRSLVKKAGGEAINFPTSVKA